MSDGAMMSQPASACTSACCTSISMVASLCTSPSRDQPVMAVAGIGIERHIAQHADLRHRLLDRAHRAADQIVGVDGFAPVFAFQLGIGVGETARSPECPGPPLPSPPPPPGRPTAAPRRAWRRSASRLFSPSITKSGQIRSARRQRVFGHQPPRPVVAAQAAHAGGGIAAHEHCLANSADCGRAQVCCLAIGTGSCSCG